MCVEGFLEFTVYCGTCFLSNLSCEAARMYFTIVNEYQNRTNEDYVPSG